MTSISDDRKSRGRPKIGAVHVGVRIPPDQIARLDEWNRNHFGPESSRPEAIRRLIELGMEAAKGKT
jgi:hypothetical protein